VTQANFTAHSFDPLQTDPVEFKLHRLLQAIFGRAT